MVAKHRPATFVRTVERGEKIDELVDEIKFRAWQEGVEHMVLQLDTGERLMVKGGRDGINFSDKGLDGERTLHMKQGGRWALVARIYGHTHPLATGPSDGDLEALVILGQGHSYIFEPGGDRRGTRIQPKAAPEG